MARVFGTSTDRGSAPWASRNTGPIRSAWSDGWPVMQRRASNGQRSRAAPRARRVTAHSQHADRRHHQRALPACELLPPKQRKPVPKSPWALVSSGLSERLCLGLRTGSVRPASPRRAFPIVQLQSLTAQERISEAIRYSWRPSGRIVFRDRVDH